MTGVFDGKRRLAASRNEGLIEAGRHCSWIKRKSCGFFTLMAILVTPAFGHDAAAERALFQKISFDQHLNVPVPLDTRFFDEKGHPVALGANVEGGPVILVLDDYGCKDLCDVLLDGLVKDLNNVALKAGRDYSVISIGIDPTDTAAVASQKKAEILKHYNDTGAQTSWHFLTGTQASIHQVADAVGFKYTYDNERKEYLHALGIVLLTPDGKTSRYFYGVDFPPRDLTFGLIEASAGRIGSPIDRALVRCFHYDPTTGKYSVAIISVLRIGCILLIVTVAGFILLMLRRDKIMNAPTQ